MEIMSLLRTLSEKVRNAYIEDRNHDVSEDAECLEIQFWGNMTSEHSEKL